MNLLEQERRVMAAADWITRAFWVAVGFGLGWWLT